MSCKYRNSCSVARDDYAGKWILIRNKKKKIQIYISLLFIIFLFQNLQIEKNSLIQKIRLATIYHQRVCAPGFQSKHDRLQ